MAYSGLPGDARQDMLKVYFKAEKMLRKQSVPAREPSQTVGEYNLLLTNGSDAEKEDLKWIQVSAWRAAYNPDPFDGSALTEAKNKLVGLKEHFKNRGAK